MTAIRYALPSSVEELDKLQDKAIKAANNARNLIQIALVATVHHLATNHDVRVARRLVDGLSETVRGKALVQYLVKYGHLTVGEIEVEDQLGKKSKVTTFTGIEGSADEHNMAVRQTWEDAKNNMWWSFKQESPYKGFDLDAYINLGIKQAAAAQAKLTEGKVDSSKINLKVQDATISRLLKLVNFDIIDTGGEQVNPEAVNDQPVAAAA